LKRAHEPPASSAGLQIEFLIKSKKRILLLTLIGAATICSSLTIIAPLNGDRSFYSDILSVITSGSALFFSLQIINRQKVKGLFPRLYALLGLGVALWFIAESIWMYYELIAGIETPFPSIADVFWLAGYIPLFYFLYGMLKNFLGTSKSMYFPLIVGSSIGLAMLANILFLIYQNADLSTSDGIWTYIVSSAYPVSDMFLIIPAIAAFIQLRKGKLTSTPWAYLVIAHILFIAGDIGFAHFTTMGGMDDLLWIWNPFYEVAYLVIASSLFWHKEFFTIDEKKLMKEWQEKNR